MDEDAITLFLFAFDVLRALVIFFVLYVRGSRFLVLDLILWDADCFGRISVDSFEEVDEGKTVLERESALNELGIDEGEEDGGAESIIKCCIFERDSVGTDEED